MSAAGESPVRVDKIQAGDEIELHGSWHKVRRITVTQGGKVITLHFGGRTLPSLPCAADQTFFRREMGR